MKILSVPEVKRIHEIVIAVTGGSPGIRDEGRLETAVLGCNQAFCDEELYPSVIDKAAYIALTVCKTQPFNDGNKRAAIASMLVMLRMNGVALSYTQTELALLGMRAEVGSVNHEGVVAWINLHEIKQK